MKVEVKTISTLIDIVPLSKYDSTKNDLAKISIGVELSKEADQDFTILIPNTDFKTSKVYLPNGTKVEIGDLDVSLEEEKTPLKDELQTILNQFITSEGDGDLNSIVEKMIYYKELYKTTKKAIIPANKQKYITLYFTKNIIKNDDGSMDFTTIIPAPLFKFANGQVKASLSIAMPLELGTDISKIKKARWNPDGKTFTDLSKSQEASQRIFLYGYWQYDPVIEVNYKY